MIRLLRRHRPTEVEPMQEIHAPVPEEASWPFIQESPVLKDAGWPNFGQPKSILMVNKWTPEQPFGLPGNKPRPENHPMIAFSVCDGRMTAATFAGSPW